MYAACDDSGNEYLMMDSILEYQNNDKAITVPYQKVVHRCRSFMRQYTVEWQLYVQWRYGSTSWKALKDLKEYHPVDTDEYAMDQEIDHEPELNW